MSVKGNPVSIENDSSELPIPPKKLRLVDLEKHYPNCFGGTARRPLKVGIAFDLLKDYNGTATLRDIKRAVSFYTNCKAYLMAIIDGGPRFDLVGAPVGEVTEEEKTLALHQLEAPKRARLAYRHRAAFLKVVEASGLSLTLYAKNNGLNADEARADLDKAQHERNLRRQNRLKLVSDFRSSGLSVEEFAAQVGCKPEAILRAVEKVDALAAAIV